MTNGDVPRDPSPAPPDPSSAVTKVFAGGIGSITAGFGVVGAVTGGLERVFRNHPKAALALIVFGAVVIAFGIVGPAVTKRIPDAVLMYGTIALVGAGAWLSWLIVDGASTKERPSVSGSLAVANDLVTVKAQVDAGGLKSSEHMLIKVEGERAGVDTVVYVARVGPNGEGKVEAPVETVVPRGAYAELIVSAQLQERISKRARRKEAVQDCGDETPYWGCIRLLVPAQ